MFIQASICQGAIMGRTLGNSFPYTISKLCYYLIYKNGIQYQGNILVFQPNKTKRDF